MKVIVLINNDEVEVFKYSADFLPILLYNVIQKHKSSLGIYDESVLIDTYIVEEEIKRNGKVKTESGTILQICEVS